MKSLKILFSIYILTAFLCLNDANGQWLTNGTHIYNSNTGNVGIGHSTPSKLLSVGKSMTEPTVMVRNLGGTGGATFEMIDDASGADWKFKATLSGGFKIRDNLNSADKIIIEPNAYPNSIYIGAFGRVAIRHTAPERELDVSGDAMIRGYFPFLSFDNEGSEHAGIVFYNGDDYRGYIYYDEIDQLIRISANQSSIANDALVVKYPNLVGIGTASPDALLHIHKDIYNSSYFGYLDTRANYFTHREIEADGNGQSCVYASRNRDVRNDGTGYLAIQSNNAIVGSCTWGDLYSFAVFGTNYNDYGRCGGVLGIESDNEGNWGSLGYTSSGLSAYGGYFTTHTSGAGKSDSDLYTSVGMGAWGDLFGADIHGKVYGAYMEGSHYAGYFHGDVVKDKLDVHLQKNATGTNDVLYTSVSADVTVVTSGTAMLSGGKASIAFDPVFSSAVSATDPVVVTITPIGESNGIHLTQVTSSGFSVAENNAGKSDLLVNYIAIGKRAGHENPDPAKEVIAPDYTGKLSRGLHADGNTETDGEGLYFERGELVVGIHPTLLPDPNRSTVEETIIPEQKSPVRNGVADDGRHAGDDPE